MMPRQTAHFPIDTRKGSVNLKERPEQPNDQPSLLHLHNTLIGSGVMNTTLQSIIIKSPRTRVSARAPVCRAGAVSRGQPSIVPMTNRPPDHRQPVLKPVKPVLF
uniref:Uncharacterized protein n=1 Tax=Knipowitschia caucasica TaxID=637954 RepID=A0AAV2KW11_KNICA